MSSALLSCVEIEPSKPAEFAVIWMHGLGADGHDFEAIVPELKLPDSLAIRFVFPHAPTRPVTINGGAVMRAWYDIYNMDRELKQDEQGIRESQRHVEQLIEREKSRGIAAKNILLAGFSQGGAIALQTGLRTQEPLAGIMALSCYLPLHEQLPQEVTEQGQSLPLFMAHGQWDPVLPLGLAEMSRNFLQGLDIAVDWHTYPMAHQVHPQEILDVRNWLLKVLKTN